MNEYKHILVAIDLSPETDQLLQQSLVMRDKFNARLSLVHVVEHLPMTYAGDLTLLNGIDIGMELQIAEEAQQQMAKIGERIGVSAADCYVVTGPISEQVLHIVREHKADLLVVGSHGRHGLALLFGSTADAILHRAPCDMLAIHIRGST